MSSCPEESKVIEYAEGELPAAQAAEVKAHISSCARCSESVKLWLDFKAVGAESEVHVPEDFTARVMRRISPPAPHLSLSRAFYAFILEWRPQIISLTAALLLMLVQQSMLVGTGTKETTLSLSDARSCQLLNRGECDLEKILGISGENQ